MPVLHGGTGGQGQTSLLDSVSNLTMEPWNVIMFNDAHHSFEQVIVQVMRAIKCSPEKAHELTMAAHNNGKAIVFTGPLERAEFVADILKEIDLKVELTKEGE